MSLMLSDHPAHLNLHFFSSTNTLELLKAQNSKNHFPKIIDVINDCIKKHCLIIVCRINHKTETHKSSENHTILMLSTHLHFQKFKKPEQLTSPDN